MREPQPHEGHTTARALERVLLRSMDLRHLLARLREAPHDQAALWDEAERLTAELEELGRTGRTPEQGEHE